jgi:hypothetical protein
MKEIKAIKQALAAGPTPGEWAHDADCSIVFSNDGDEVAVLERNPTGNYRRQVFFNGEYIAACNPDAMSKVLAHIEAQQAEIEQLRAQRGEPENIDPTGSNLPAEQANTPEVTSQGQVSVPVLWRYRDSEQCIKPMDGYTPGEGWTPLYAAPQPERKPMTDEDTLALFNRIQRKMRFTDADAKPFASGVASAEFFHGIKEDKP